LLNGDSGQQIRLSEASDHAFTSLPGLLKETMTVDGLSIRQSLWFDRIDARHSGMALINVTIENTTQQQKKIAIGWSGKVFEDKHRLETDGHQLSLLGESGYRMRLNFGSETGDLKLDGYSYQTRLTHPHLIGAGDSLTTTVAIDLSLDGDQPLSLTDIDARQANINQSYQLNRNRWNQWLAAVDPDPEAGKAASVIAVKSLQTMINNWRGPAGRLAHHGMFPSHNVWYFNGYWAWDTWKQAVGVLHFDAKLAKALVRGMFSHQDKNGMIPDVVYLDSKEDNWRDSKPPLAGWAIDAIYQQSGDLDFVRELYPKLVAYHEFWYRDRDHNNNGLCEYGSTDGTLEAARWESGMDNAVRFDNSKMLQNGESAWSMNQESVDLNSYLLVEKQALARLANALGKDDQIWLEQADRLKDQIRETFFDEVDGWFYDVNIEDGSFVQTQSPEGWIPLWAGVASQQQAARLRDVMLAPDKFRTYIPFPTVAADNTAFSEGYWRGLVWLDQAYFAIAGLRHYGFESDANELTRQLFSNLKGVAEPGVPIYENYHPLTGEGRNVSHFSWSAAHLLMLIRDIK
jgi:putative isomerase